MSPKSSRMFTLLGEAYLDSGQNTTAAEDFKKALQLDPDNKRAREGYNERFEQGSTADRRRVAAAIAVCTRRVSAASCATCAR